MTAPPRWQKLPGTGVDVGVGANGAAWLIGRTATAGGYGIHRWTGNSWQSVPGGAVAA